MYNYDDANLRQYIFEQDHKKTIIMPPRYSKLDTTVINSYVYLVQIYEVSYEDNDKNIASNPLKHK